MLLRFRFNKYNFMFSLKTTYVLLSYYMSILNFSVDFDFDPKFV